MKLRDQLLEQFEQLKPEQQEYLLDFARVLANKPGTIRGETGASIVQAVGYFDAQSLNEIEAAIMSGTEEIDWRGWE
jgi:hypothetical protein